MAFVATVNGQTLVRTRSRTRARVSVVDMGKRTVHGASALLLDHFSAKVAAMASAIVEVFMGDKSPKSKQKGDKQKQEKGKNDAAKAQAKQQPKVKK
jgi:hypothetical protein